MTNNVSQRKSRLKTFFTDDREIDTLVRSLARKLLREDKTELPSSILAQISGVPEELWSRTFSKRRSFLNDLLSAPIQKTIKKLKILDGEERNFIDKLGEVLKLIFKINSSYPEVMILFHGIAMNEDLNKELQVSEAMDELIFLAMDILKKQAYEEDIVTKDSAMEKLLFFLIQQMMETFQRRMFDYCEDYIEDRDMAVFPDEDEMITTLMAPIIENLDGITAV